MIESALIPLSLLPWDGLILMMWSLSLQAPVIESSNIMDLDVVILVLIGASFVWDSINYYLGRRIHGSFVDKWVTVFGRHIVPIAQDQIDKANKFILSYGYRGYTLGRILPIFRNFMPFVAGMTKTPYHKFIIHDMIGAIFLICWLIGLGRWFGGVAWAQNNMTSLMRWFWWLIVLWPLITSWAQRLIKLMIK